MAIGMIFQGALSQEQYERVKNQVLPGNEPAAGMLYHVAGPSADGGWCVVEVWESQEAAERYFQQGLRQALQEANISIQPVAFQVVNTIKP